MTFDLFDAPPRAAREPIGPAAFVLPGFALPRIDALLEAIADVSARAPFRHLVTPGGFTMSVALTNCGALGWTSDRRGYRYSAVDPDSGAPWPAMPEAFAQLARDAAALAGFDGFAPDACLVNRYQPGSRLSLHQDRDERDHGAPIVSVSLGLPATFLWGGAVRSDRPRRIALHHGDVMVWGGPTRLSFHGVDILQNGMHMATGACRYNLTFRQAGTREERRC